MNNYLKIATEYISAEVGDDFAIVKDSIVDLNNLYCFVYQTKEYLNTGNFHAMAVGQGYHFINKNNNRIFSYGSGFSFEEALADIKRSLIIEAGIRKHKSCFELQKRFDIQINQISKKQLLIDLLKKHAITYVIPEIVGDSIFRIPKKYNSKVLEERFQELPAIFKGIGIDTCLYLTDELINTECCEFDLICHIDTKRAAYVNTATPEDLKPVW